jgi:hypothetical protein
VIARQVALSGGDDAARIGAAIVDGLSGPDLRCAFVFADSRLDAAILARVVCRGLAPAPVLGCTAASTIPSTASVIALGLYGDWLRVGVGVATDLSSAALTRARDAVHQAARQLGIATAALDPVRHVGVTVVDGRSGNEEAFCVGSAATAPQLKFVGGMASSSDQVAQPPVVWTAGSVFFDSALIAILETELPYDVLESCHLVPTNIRTVVTAAAGRRIMELDGFPAVRRLTELVAPLGKPLDLPQPSQYAFARYVDGAPYVRSIRAGDGDELILACGVEAGHVLRVMRPGNLIGNTRTDLAAVAERVGGTIAALLAFSCVHRRWESLSSGGDQELAAVLARYPTIGFDSAGEQIGMLLVNHTLTGLAIGGRS